MAHDLLRHLASLRAHGEWADTKLVVAAQQVTGDATAVRRELSHVRGAQEVWLSRIEGRAATIPVWPAYSAVEIERAGAVIDERMRRLFDTLTPESLAQEIAYSNLQGLPFRTELGEILLHLLMHGQYHRGKANVALRDVGAATVGVDYIAWHREFGSSLREV
ncbi:DinB family protein [Gemmatimonas sp.]|uniref:DinB family protein n=1 Tax=Gemmatimonas sp. TaxID=1962908 RepID=UPI00286D7243|nr:DinB family protein [Gemmatimonas sp.]